MPPDQDIVEEIERRALAELRDRPMSAGLLDKKLSEDLYLRRDLIHPAILSIISQGDAELVGWGATLKITPQGRRASWRISPSGWDCPPQ